MTQTSTAVRASVQRLISPRQGRDLRQQRRNSSTVWRTAWAAAGLLPTLTAAEINATYVGVSGGAWNVAGNWNPATAFPNNGGGDTYNALFPSNLGVTLGQDITIQQLSISSGLSLSGAFSLNLENGFSFGGNNNKTLSGVTLNLNMGTGVWSGAGSLLLGSAATLNNFGVLDIQNNAALNNAGGGGTFHNQAGATLQKSAGGGTTSFNSSITFINDGIIDVDSGSLDFNAGATFNNGTQFTGTGLTRAVLGTFGLNGTLSANDNFELAGGTVTGTHTLSGGTWKWNSGILGGHPIKPLQSPLVPLWRFPLSGQKR